MSDLTRNDAAEQIRRIIIDNETDEGVYLGNRDVQALEMSIGALLSTKGNNSEFPNSWIPIYDGDGQMPPIDDEGYSDYILLLFSNANFLRIGRYTFTKFGLFVDAWEPYQTEDES